MNYKNKKSTVFLTLLLSLLISGFVLAQEKIIEVKFAEPPVSDSDVSRTLQSLVKVRGINETYSTGGLYLLTHYGNREELFEKENQKAIEHPFIDQTWRYCSVFSAADGDSVILGRNWDNQNVGSIIVNLYRPSGGYASVSFSRAIDLGFPENVGLEDMRSGPYGERLLLAPFYVMDGINEHGLSVAVAGVRHVTHDPQKGKERMFTTYLIRKILDRTKDIDEAVKLAENYTPFLLDKDSMDGHLYIADSSGRSVVLEYENDQWLKVYGEKSWQVLNNKPVYNVPDATLREKCWRYRSLSETLDKTEGKVNWKAGLKMLQDVKQGGTTWSVVYSPASKDIYFSVYQSWDTIYHLKKF
jgi:hypothetical protein